VKTINDFNCLHMNLILIGNKLSSKINIQYGVPQGKGGSRSDFRGGPRDLHILHPGGLGGMEYPPFKQGGSGGPPPAKNWKLRLIK